jgi:Protein of unknown function (DUF4239)
MVWLTSLPAWELVAGFLALALLLAISSRLALKALVPMEDRDAAYSIAAPLMPALGAAFAILMALTLANEASALTSAQGIVSNEAADSARLAWASTNPGIDAPPIQRALLTYLQATTAHEWSGASAALGNDPATANAIAALEHEVRAQAARKSVGTPASTELLASVDAITSDRRARLAAASHELPGLYVVTLALSGAALVVNASVLTLRGGRRSGLLVGELAIVVGLSMALLFAIGTPWRGAIVVSKQPIDTVIRDLTSGYFHS